MFLVKSKKPGVTWEGIWSNDVGDDFLQFIPNVVSNATGVLHTKDDLDVEIIDEDPSFLKMKMVGGDTDLIVHQGKPYTANIDEEGKRVEDKLLKTKKLKRWPYDAEGNFLGNEAE